MINNLIVRYILQEELDDVMLEKIIALKQQHWNYTRDSHKQWIDENLYKNEFHLCVELSTGQIIAYLNVVNLEVFCNEKQTEFLGVGNVCVDKMFSGKGLGLLLIQIVDFFIRQIGKPAVLLCRKNLSEFYNKAGWHEFYGKTFLLGRLYSGGVFLNYNSDAAVFHIQRNF